MVLAEHITGGFADPVFNGQAVFRAVMDAMARPGSIHHLPELAQPPSPLSASAAAVALTLCDQDTPVFLDAGLREVCNHCKLARLSYWRTAGQHAG